MDSARIVLCMTSSCLLVNLRHRRWIEVTVFTPVCLLLTKSKDFVSILMTSVLCLFVCLCVCLFVCVFVCRHDNSRTEEATNVKLHHVIQEGDG